MRLVAKTNWLSPIFAEKWCILQGGFSRMILDNNQNQHKLKSPNSRRAKQPLVMMLYRQLQYYYFNYRLKLQLLSLLLGLKPVMSCH